MPGHQVLYQLTTILMVSAPRLRPPHSTTLEECDSQNVGRAQLAIKMMNDHSFSYPGHVFIDKVQVHPEWGYTGWVELDLHSDYPWRLLQQVLHLVFV